MDKEPSLREPMSEVYCVIFGSTKNLPGVVTEVSSECYGEMARQICVKGNAGERSLGKVLDSTRYYDFSGSNMFLDYGLAQVGVAKTADNMEGFGMIRLFSNGSRLMRKLEEEVGRF